MIAVPPGPGRRPGLVRLPAVIGLAAIGVALGAVPPAAHAALDLAQVTRERLDNGLTLLVLEERALPLASVQMLYKVGARDEPSGRTGLAHFVEHMAFRATESFPGTEVVSRIYAAGGEWHGYTWIDQTTYFETLPREELSLALAIEADRMARLLLPAEEVEAERGAVLAELNGYQNDPATVLKDAVLATSFLQHPYRNNTIGWPSEVERLTHADIEAFYRTHYRPANAVLAVVGDVDAPAVAAEVRERFGGLPAGPPTPTPRTVEPPQTGERRVTLRLPRGEGRFEIAYRAPAVAHPDYPAFLLLQELLGGSGGVSFLQATFGTPVAEGGRLAGAADDLVTWFPPSALPYVLTISGSRGGRSAAEVEADLAARLERLGREAAAIVELETARRRLLEELTFDVETTEDAAHQLAFFEGLGALEVLLELPGRVGRVSPADVRRVAAAYLQPWMRTVGWVEAPGGGSRAAADDEPSDERVEDEVGGPVAGAGPNARQAPAAGAPAAATGGPVGEPRSFRLRAGLPVHFQRSGLSPTGYLLVVLPAGGCDLGARAVVGEPAWRHASAGFRFLAGDAERALREARAAVDACSAAGERAPAPFGSRPEADPSATADPEAALGRALAELLAIEPGVGPGEAGSRQSGPLLLALAGDLDPAAARRLAERFFGDLAPGQAAPPPPPRRRAAEKRVDLGVLAQARLGYAVPAPPPSEPAGDAWRMLLYIVSHGYEGRLGVEAIGRRGLVYHIDADYHCDGASAWISLSTGVDPPKLGAMRGLLQETLAGLRATPPSESELAEARRHLLGRRRTAAQSNRELAERLARDAICLGGPLSPEAYRERLERIGLEQVRAAVPAFVDGATAVVE